MFFPAFLQLAIRFFNNYCSFLMNDLSLKIGYEIKSSLIATLIIIVNFEADLDNSTSILSPWKLIVKT